MSYKDVISLKQFKTIQNKNGSFLFYNDGSCSKCQEILNECSKLTVEQKSELVLVSISHFHSDFLHQNLSSFPFIIKYSDNLEIARSNNLKKVQEIILILEY